MAEAVVAPARPDHASASIRESVGGRRLIFVLVGVILGMLLAALDGTVVGTAMPTIVADLGGLAHYSWVFTAYMLASTVTVLIYGKLSDIYGRRLFFILAMVLFLIGSALSGLSHTMTQLILFRGLQGLGAGGLMPIAMAIIGDIFPPAQRAKWGAGLTAIFGLATIIGPSLGGIITDNLGWQWVFYVNMPIGAVAILTTSIAMPGHSRRQSHSIDYLGVAALSAWSIPLLLAFSLGGSQYRWGSAQIIGMLLFAVAMLGVFLLVERRAKEPVLSLGIFRNRIFTVSMIATFLTSVGMFGAISYLPLFVQGVVGSSATNAGAVLTPMMLGFIVSSMISGQILARTGKYKIMALTGFAIGAVGLLLLSRMDIHATNSMVAQRMVITGLGIGVSMSLFTIVVQNAFPLSQMGAVTAALTFFRSIGGTIGVALLGSVMTNRFNSAFDANLPETLKQRVPPEQLAALRNPQLLLSHEATDRIHASFAGFGAQSEALFGQLMLALRQSLATAITSLFFAAMIAMILAFVAVIFLREIPLRKTNAPEKVAGAPPAASIADIPTAARAASAAAATLAEQSGPVASLAVEAAGNSPPPVAPPLSRPPGILVAESVAMQAPPTLDVAAPTVASKAGDPAEVERLVAELARLHLQIERTHEVSASLTERLAALEDLSEGVAAYRLQHAAMQQAIAALDQLVHSLPPADWHRAQYARMAAIEQRIAALEQICAQLAAEQQPRDPVARPAMYGYKYAD